LTACGEDSSGSSVTTPAIPPAAATPVNVSLAENGGSVVATYGGAMANFVNDGDNTTTTNFWSGNIADDAVTIDFGLSRTITNNHEQSRKFLFIPTTRLSTLSVRQNISKFLLIILLGRKQHRSLVAMYRAAHFPPGLEKFVVFFQHRNQFDITASA
jgi:hypothetical protein